MKKYVVVIKRKEGGESRHSFSNKEEAIRDFDDYKLMKVADFIEEVLFIEEKVVFRYDPKDFNPKDFFYPESTSVMTEDRLREWEKERMAEYNQYLRETGRDPDCEAYHSEPHFLDNLL